MSISDEIVRIGRVVNNPFRHIRDTPYQVYADQQMYLERGIKLSNYASPARGPAAELESLIAQHAGVRAVETPRELEMAMQLLERRYPRSIDPWPHITTKEYYDYLIDAVNPDASPGWPYAQRHTLNRELLKDYELLSAVVELTYKRLVILSSIPPELLLSALEEDPLIAVVLGLADPHRLFVKKEPHPKRKVDSKSWRLINMLSLVDNLVDRFLFTNQDETEIRQWRHIPSKCGAGLEDSDCEALARYAYDHGLNLETDATGWDIRVPEFLLRADVELRSRLNHASASWKTAARNVTTMATRRVLMTSDGVLMCRSTPGGQSSGRKITSSSNSRMRALLAAVVGCRFDYVPQSMSQGDDCVEYLPMEISINDYVQCIAGLGIKIKVAKRCRYDDFGFCSQRIKYGGTVVQPENPEKQFVNFAMCTPEVAESSYNSLLKNMRHCPNEIALAKLAYSEKTGPTV